MSYLKNLPNLLTLCNLIMGFGACLLFAQTSHALLRYDPQTGDYTIRFFSEELIGGSICVMIAAGFDLIDGLVARLLKVESLLGEQLDSLADIVSFGIAPGILLFQMLKYSWAQIFSDLQIPVLLLLPTLCIPCAAAYRLARFNIAKKHADNKSFQGLPTPATGLALIALPWSFFTIESIRNVIYHPASLYAILLFFSWLMLRKISIRKIEFQSKGDLLFIGILVLVSLLGFFILGYFMLFISVVLYAILGILFPSSPTSRS